MTIGRKIIGGYVIVLVRFMMIASGVFYALDRTQQRYDAFIETREKLAAGASELGIAVSGA